MYKPLTIVFAILLLSGCSFKTTYGWLDWIVPWYVDDYVSLNASQEAVLDHELALVLDWHQREELKRYAAEIEVFRGQIATQSWTPRQWLEQRSRIQSHQQRLLAVVAPGLKKIITSLSEQQINELLVNVDESFNDYLDEAEERSDEEWAEHWQERTEDTVEKWLGRLTSQQKQLIENWSAVRPYDYEIVRQQGLHWRSLLKQLLKPRPEHQSELTFQQIFMNDPVTHTDTFATYLKQVRLAYAQLYADLHPSLTKKQRQHLDRELADWQQDFIDVANEYEPDTITNDSKELTHGPSDARPEQHAAAGG
ncbi:DUF6279 family lipoprotein [Echinimonas agarilytica]|uniref:DUF6279 family lipoprotein n=1 Tax=Echinimonas agarilytica TaxID=1215918 RepID=A0AA41W6W0_9GAMM|nr:DUF6279 family lipoprotein [Echinimonas agarilytica]MCM2679864.1 DUF6279 family lipoprotein [Echinimonas agarilytica]